MNRVVKIQGRDGVVLAYPEVEPRSGELVHFVAVAVQGYHAKEVASTMVRILLGAIADPAYWTRGPSAMVTRALAQSEPMTVHGGVQVSVAVAVRKGRTVEVAFTGDLQIRLASAREARWHTPGVKHGEQLTSTSYVTDRGDALVVLSQGILEEFPTQELLSVVLSSETDVGAGLIEKRISGSTVPQLFYGARFGGAAPPIRADIPLPTSRTRWNHAIPWVAAILAVAALIWWAPWQRLTLPSSGQGERAEPEPRPAETHLPSAAESVHVPPPSTAEADTTATDTTRATEVRDSTTTGVAIPSGTLQWKQRIGGSNFSSSPALVGMKVYVGSKDHHLYCLLASSGEVLWKLRTGGGIGSSPAFDTNSIYFGSYDSTFYCVDRHAGRAIWKQKVGASIGASPLIFGSTVCCGCKDGRVYAWDTRSGVAQWRLETGAEVWARPLVIGSRLFIGSLDRRFYCVDASTGEHLWSIPVDGAVYTTAAAGPESTVIFGTNAGTMYQLRQRDGTTTWSAKFDALYSSPLIADGMLFFGCKGGDFRCISLSDHREVWKYTTGSDVRSSPVLLEDGVLIGSYDGQLYAFSMSGKRRWVFDANSPIYSTPEVGSDRIYFGDMTGWFYSLGS